MKMHLLGVGAFLLLGCNKPTAEESKKTPSKPKSEIQKNEEKQMPKIEEIELGSGHIAEEGDLIVVEYKGSLTDGTEFDTNQKEGRQPFAFRLGAGQVIKGWDLGVKGMKVEGKRKLTIPYALAYGEKGRPPRIPEKSDLIFDIKLLDIVKKGEERTLISKTLTEGTGKAAKKGDMVEVHYTGKLINGTKFDSSVERKETFVFKLGAQKVIEGWDQGVVGMKVGEKRLLKIPPALAYGEQGAHGAIHPNQILEFEIELISIK